MASLDRIPEPELMDGAGQAAAYAAGDFAQPHQRFADEVARRFPELRDGAGALLDVGCGPGDVTVRLARACPGWTLVGVDGAAEMLRLARQRIADAGLDDRVRVEQVRLPSPGLRRRRFDAVVSTSVLHHLADPGVLWEVVAGVVGPGAPVAVMDLLRPGSAAELDRLVGLYAADEPPVLREDFRRSLQASYRPDEVRAQLAGAGLDHLAVEVISDRHLLITGRR